VGGASDQAKEGIDKCGNEFSAYMKRQVRLESTLTDLQLTQVMQTAAGSSVARSASSVAPSPDSNSSFMTQITLAQTGRTEQLDPSR
jgi:hypothetical protein